jgi:hypothetical protein
MKKIRNLASVAVLLAALSPASALAQGPSGTLRTTGGGTTSIAEMRGRVVVLWFGGVVDPQSPEELPALEQLARRYQGKGVDIYWVSLDPASTSDAEVTQFATRNGYRGKILRDSGAVLRSVSAGRKPQLPTIVVLDAAGAVAGSPIAGFDRDVAVANRLAAIIDPLLK